MVLSIFMLLKKVSQLYGSMIVIATIVSFYDKNNSTFIELLRLWSLLAAYIEILSKNHTGSHEENTTLVSTYCSRTNKPQFVGASANYYR